MMHGGSWISLRTCQNSAVLELDITGVPAVFITKNCHQRGFSRLAKSRRYRLEIDWQVGIPIHDKKMISQERKRFAHRAAGSNKTRAIKRILQPDTTDRAITKLGLY